MGDGVYLVVSASAPSSAYIKVTGKFGSHGGDGHYSATTMTPVDASGNSIAGTTEASQEALYKVLDITISGTQRDNPTYFWTTISGMPNSFIGSTDAVINAVINNNPTVLALYSGLANNSVVTITFADGSIAEFAVNVIPMANGTVKVVVTWTGIAHDKMGRLINRDGTLVPNPNTGGSGGGNVGVHGFGPGSNWNFNFHGQPFCTLEGTVTGENGQSTTDIERLPC
jgi:hypothetical protein